MGKEGNHVRHFLDWFTHYGAAPVWYGWKNDQRGWVQPPDILSLEEVTRSAADWLGESASATDAVGLARQAHFRLLREVDQSWPPAPPLEERG
jgi:hypothetical protein